MEEKKIIYSYTVTRFNDGSTTVNDNPAVESEQTISTQEIFLDIKRLAKHITEKEEMDRVRVAVINAMNEYMTAVNNNAAAEAAVEMPDRAE